MEVRGSAIRPAAVAGMFYPGTKKELEEAVRELTARVPPSPEAAGGGELRAIVVPHAGYMYSGATAGRAYGLLRGLTFDTCILIGPSHREYFRGVTVYPGGAYQTPLGVYPIDAACREALLAETPIVRAAMEGHREEHSLEVQIPFLQHVLPHAAFVPLVMGEQDPATCRELGEAVGRVARGKRILLVASSDLSHYYPSDVARKKDHEVISLIEAYDIQRLFHQLEAETCEACGGGPIAAVMTAAAAAAAAVHATIIDACNSGDVTGERSRVVGYCSAAIWTQPS